MNPEELAQALAEYMRGIAPQFAGDQNRIEVGRTRFGRLFAHIVSPAFDGTEFTQRQERVWQFLRNKFSNDQLQWVFRVSTKGSGEQAVEDAIDDLNRP